MVKSSQTGSFIVPSDTGSFLVGSDTGSLGSSTFTNDPVIRLSISASGNMVVGSQDGLNNTLRLGHSTNDNAIGAGGTRC